MLTISRADNQPCMVAISHGGNQVGKESSRGGQAGDCRPGRSRRATLHQCLEAAAPIRAQHLRLTRVSTAHHALHWLCTVRTIQQERIPHGTLRKADKCRGRERERKRQLHTHNRTHTQCQRAPAKETESDSSSHGEAQCAAITVRRNVQQSR